MRKGVRDRDCVRIPAVMSERNREFRIGLGVCGGIAAYKAVEVLRLLQKAGCKVRVAMTRHATEFVRPLTFSALTGEYVIVDDYDPQNPDPIAHVNFSQNIDLLLIVPATANTIAKLANGIADDFLSSTYLASDAPVMIAPAMNVSMWNHPATQRNIAALKADGVHFADPVAGELACKTVGTGKLEDVENIAAQALSMLRSQGAPQDLAGETLLITVGGTREAIDPVRFISNHSSGKMGFAVASAASARGASVIAVYGAVSVAPPPGIDVVRAISAAEMHDAVMARSTDATIFIGAAAVADFRPKAVASGKIKKTANDSLTIELEKTADILSSVAAARAPGQIIVGFAAETNDVIEYARSKMEKKGLDMVVANDVTKAGAGFNSDDNIATIITRNDAIELSLMPKRELADRILDEILALRRGERADSAR